MEQSNRDSSNSMYRIDVSLSPLQILRQHDLRTKATESKLCSDCHSSTHFNSTDSELFKLAPSGSRMLQTCFIGYMHQIAMTGSLLIKSKIVSSAVFEIKKAISYGEENLSNLMLIRNGITYSGESVKRFSSGRVLKLH